MMRRPEVLVAAAIALGLLAGWMSAGRGGAAGQEAPPALPNFPALPPMGPNAGEVLAAYDSLWRAAPPPMAAAQPAQAQAAAPPWRLAGIVGGEAGRPRAALFVQMEGGTSRLVREGETTPDGRKVLRLTEISVHFEQEGEVRLYRGAP